MSPFSKTTRRTLFVAFAAALLTLPAQAKDKSRTAPVPKPAVQYPAFESHAAEHVTVAAVPCTVPKECAFFRNDYLGHDILPVWVVITNDRDQPVVLGEVRIQFLPEEGDRIQAATPDDLNRRLFNLHQARGTKLPMGITIHHEPVDEKITNDDADFGFRSLTVAPHTTAAGYVYYDVSYLGLIDTALKGASLYLKEMSSMDEKGKKVQLFAFTIPFEKSSAKASESK
jgi:hypothetical protein